MALNKEIIIQTLEDNKDRLKGFSVKKIELFGSYAYDKQKENSDIDLLVEFEEGRGLFDDYVSLLRLVRDLFNKETDIVKPSLVREELKEPILGGKRIGAKI